MDGQILADVIWKFRNAHTHSYYPFITDKIRGAVDWLYADPRNRIGVAIANVEANFNSYSNCLWGLSGEWLRLCPQILFVYFKKGINKYLDSVVADDEVGNIFIKNCENLAEVYYFEV